MGIDGIIEDRKRRWRDFMRGRGAPFLFIVRTVQASSVNLPLARFAPGNEKLFIESSWRGFEEQCRNASLVDDDFIPHLSCITGTEIFAEAFGCSVERPSDNMPFALPRVHSAAEADNIRDVDLGGSSLERFFSIADELRRRGGDNVPLRMIDVQSPTDVAALIWEKADFMMAMIESPDSVRALSLKVRRLLVQFLEEWFGRHGVDFIAHYPEYYMERGITLSEDECGALSAEIFDELILEDLNFLSERFGGIGIHCCADSRHQWENFKKVKGLRLINLVCPPTRKGDEFIVDALKSFSGTCAQFHYGWTPSGEYSGWPGQYPAGSRVVIDVTVKSLDEARKACLALRRAQER